MEGLVQKKAKKLKARSALKEGYENQLETYKEEMAQLDNANFELSADRDAKKQKFAELQNQIQEMKALLANLSLAKEGLNKYIEGSK